MTTQTTPGLLSLPTFGYTYDPTRLQSNRDGSIGTANFLGDYYGQMASNYLPSIDTFAQANAGKMVNYDPNSLMSIEDFGLNAGKRGALRGNIEQTATHQFVDDTGDNGGVSSTGYFDANGNPISTWGLKNGTELFRKGNEENQYQLESAGVYHKDTAEEALNKLLARGGDSAQGGRSDFGGATTFADMGKDHSGKWGQDWVNDPAIADKINDPAWVTKDAEGSITTVRAELLPYVLREALGEEFRDINRGSTKQSDALGTLVKTLVIGAVTGGLGTAAAGAMGMTTTVPAVLGAGGAVITPATTALTAGGMVTSGVISGGLSAGLQGGNILEGAALGGLGGAAQGIINPKLADMSSSLGTNIPETVNAAGKLIPAHTQLTTTGGALSGGMVGAARGAITGKDVGDSAIIGAINGAVSVNMPKTNIGPIDGTVTNIVGSYIANALGIGAGSGASAPLQPTTTTPETETTQDPVVQTPAATVANNRWASAPRLRRI